MLCKYLIIELYKKNYYQNNDLIFINYGKIRKFDKDIL